MTTPTHPDIQTEAAGLDSTAYSALEGYLRSYGDAAFPVAVDIMCGAKSVEVQGDYLAEPPPDDSRFHEDSAF